MNTPQPISEFEANYTKHSKAPVTVGLLGKLLKEVCAAVRQVREGIATNEAHVARHDSLAVLNENRLQALERLVRAQAETIAALERRPGEFKGDWRPDTEYQRNDATQFDGGLWIARSTTRETPGGGHQSWRLAVSRGKRGRDGAPCRCAAS